MRYIYAFLFVFVMLFAACGGGHHHSPPPIVDTCYDTVALYPESAVSYYVMPSYYVIYAYDSIYYILAIDMPDTAFDPETCLTADELEALTLPRELVDEATNTIDPVLYWDWIFGHGEHDGEDCDECGAPPFCPPYGHGDDNDHDHEHENNGHHNHYGWDNWHNKN